MYVKKRTFKPLFVRPKVKLRRREVWVGSKCVRLSPQQFRIFLEIYFHGRREQDDIIESLYAHCENGGPEYAPRCIALQSMYANAKLRPLGIAMASTQNGWRELV